MSRLNRWRKARAVFLRPDTPQAERAVAEILGRSWIRAQIYGRARRMLLEKSAERLLAELEEGLGPFASQLRVAPEDPAQTKWDAMGNLTPLPEAGHQVQALWLVDVLQSGEFFVEFQPIFLLEDGDTFGFEGLLARAAVRRRAASGRGNFPRRPGAAHRAGVRADLLAPRARSGEPAARATRCCS